MNSNNTLSDPFKRSVSVSNKKVFHTNTENASIQESNDSTSYFTRDARNTQVKENTIQWPTLGHTSINVTR